MVGRGVVVNGIVVFALDNAANIPLELVSMSLSSNSLSIVRWVRIRLKKALDCHVKQTYMEVT